MSHPAIVTHPADVLRWRTETLDPECPETRRLLDRLKAVVGEARGLGLAAPQIGAAKRACVAVGEDGPVEFVNPEIVRASKETAVGEEGCLSIPGVFMDVERPARIVVRYANRCGGMREATFEGRFAAIVQHEIDHLDGVLFPDRLSRTRARMAWKRYSKVHRRRS